jgi:hypothetical protein
MRSIVVSSWFADSRTHGAADRCHLQFLRSENSGMLPLLVRSDRIAQHVTSGVGGYEFLTQFIQWGAIVVRDGDDVALRSAHAWYFFV